MTFNYVKLIYRNAANHSIVHALRQRDQDNFLFLLECSEGNKLTYRSIEINFPQPPVMCATIQPITVCPSISIYDENNIKNKINGFIPFSSSMRIEEETPNLFKLFSEFKKVGFEYDFNRSARDEQIKI